VNDDRDPGAYPFAFDFLESSPDPLDDFALGNGWPRLWEQIDDIIGGLGDLLGKVGEMFKDLWDAVWTGIGGGLRWVWDRVYDSFDHLRRQLYTYFEWVGGFVNAVALWTWSSASDAGRGIYGGIAGGLGWVAGKVSWWGGAVRDWVEDWAGWLWDTASWGAKGIYGGIRGAFDWLRGKVEWWGGAVRDWVQDWAEWLWTTASWGALGITGGIAGGFRWAWGKITDARDYVLDGVDFTRSWLWERGPDAAGRFTGGITGGLGWVVENVGSAADGVTDYVGDLLGGLVDKLGGIFMPIFEALGGGITDAIKWPFEAAFAPMIEVVGGKLAIPGKMLRGEYGSVSEWADDIMDPPPLDNIVKTFGWVLLAIPSILMGLAPVFQPAMATMIQDANRDFRPRLLGEAEILDAQLRELPIHYGYDEQLERWGYRDEDISALRALRQPIPGSTDLIRMGVREVFTPEIAEAFGQFEDFPARFGEVMELVGYGLRPTGELAGGGPGGGRTWAEAYWAAHWDLPSVTMAFEMYHREVTLPDGSTFDEAQLMTLMRALDVMPHWRDPLRQIAYNVITRVDIRRLYQDGIVEEDEVERTYRHMGYSPEDAAKITAMVKIRYPRGGKDEADDLRQLTLTRIKEAYFRRLIDREEAFDKLVELDHPEEDAELVLSIWDFDLEWNPSLRFEVPFKDLSRSVITDAYRRGIFDFNRAAVELVEGGLTQDDAEIVLQIEDLKLESELTDMEIDLVLQDAKAQDITLAEAETRLLGLGLEPARVTFLVRREELRRLTKTRTLTVSQISRAYRDGIFTEAVFLEKVGAQGFTADDAAVLLGLEGPVEQAKRQLSRSEVERLLRRQEITAADALARLTAMGYLPEDAELVVGSVERQLERALVERLLEQALLTRAEALGRLVKVGFSSADAELIVRSREQKMAEAAAEPEPEETPSRELSRTLVEKFLREGLLDREQALERLVRAGFTAGDAELIVLSVERKLAEEAAEV